MLAIASSCAGIARRWIFVFVTFVMHTLNTHGAHFCDLHRGHCGRESHQLHCVSIRLAPHLSSFSTTLTLCLFSRSLKTQEMQHGEVEDNGGVVSNDDRLQDNMDLMFSKEESPMIPCGDGNRMCHRMNPAAAGASVLLPKDAFTKDHVDKHAQFDEVGESILPRNFEKVCKTLEKFQKMEAEGTATFVLSPGTRP